MCDQRIKSRQPLYLHEMIVAMNVEISPVVSFIFTCSLFTATDSLPSSALSSECGNTKAVLVDDKCIIYDNAQTDWFNARKTCANYGTQLATISSPNQINESLKVISNGTFLDSWTGGNDLDIEGRFIWDEDRRPVVGELWSPPSQQNVERDCLYISDDSRLNKASCRDLKSVLCMYQAPISVYQFGDDKSYLCHCLKAACETNGYCNDYDNRCAKGWFGVYCQSRSLPVDMDGQLDLLTDDDDWTCTSDIKLPITIKLRPGSYFTWISLVAADYNAYFGKVKLYFIMNNVKVSCKNVRRRPYRSSLDVFCANGPSVIDGVIITWSEAITVCSIYVNGELNFAVFQNASVPSGVDSSSLLPIDGRRSPTDGCFKGIPEDGNQTWTLTLKEEKIIHEIIIYRKPKVAGYSHMNGFHVQGYNDRDKLLFEYNDGGENAERPTVWILTHISLPMKRVIISIDNASDQRYLELCEVEAFGDCTPLDNIYHCFRTCNRFTCPLGECRGQYCYPCVLNSKGKCFNAFTEKEPNQWLKILVVTVIIMTILLLVLAILALHIFEYQVEQEEKRLQTKQSEISRGTGLNEEIKSQTIAEDQDDRLEPDDNFTSLV